MFAMLHVVKRNNASVSSSSKSGVSGRESYSSNRFGKVCECQKTGNWNGSAVQLNLLESEYRIRPVLLSKMYTAPF